MEDFFFFSPINASLAKKSENRQFAIFFWGKKEKKSTYLKEKTMKN